MEAKDFLLANTMMMLINVLLVVVNIALVGIGAKFLTEYHKDKSRDIAIEKEMKAKT